jgi:TatD DNase family protein
LTLTPTYRCATSTERFDDLHATLERMSEAAVEGTVIIGTDVASSLEALEIASLRHAGVELYATAGIHPHDATNDIDELRRAVANEIATRGRERLVGIGECGLDYYYEHSPRDDQRRTFAAQIALAHEHDLALVIHARDAWDDLFDVLATESTPPRTVIHCFTGGPEDAERCLGAGCDISISGVVTFKNAQNVRDALRVVPLERLHVETDSPFLAPVPHRGRTNEPVARQCCGGLRGPRTRSGCRGARQGHRAQHSTTFCTPLRN